jgi:hypothetical protein
VLASWASVPKSGRLFQYTVAAGLKGILESGRLHATDLRFMNDSGELRYAQNLFREVLDSALPHYDSRLREPFSQGIGLLDRREDQRFYAVCFCEEGDVLSQWRAYGSSGGGYAVGFDVRALVSLFAPTIGSNLLHSTGSQAFHRIDYNPWSQLERVRTVIDGTLSACHECQSNFAGHPDLGNAVSSCVSHMVRSLFWEQTRIKHPLFHEEREWRIVEIEQRTNTFRVSRAGLVVPQLGPITIHELRQRCRRIQSP